MMNPLAAVSTLVSLVLSLAGCASRPLPDGEASPVIAEDDQDFGATEITRWQDGKTGAVSLTFDDGIITQFTAALPTMNRLGLPGTFYVVTGEIEGSKHPPKFIGRPIEEIIRETKDAPTDAENFLERASALQYAGYQGAFQLHRDVYAAFRQGRIGKAHELVDDAYARIRRGELEPGPNTTPEAAESAENSWDDFRKFAAQGHEFGSHTVSHAALAVLDEPNMLYELEKSRDDILNQLGPEHTFSMEGPFGVSDPRAMEYLLQLYPAPRNIMRDPYLEILLRGSKKEPGTSDKEYVQWQRGPDGTKNDENTTDTSLDEMKAWVDTALADDKIWLTLVFHGVGDKGWSALPYERVEAYLEYIKEKEDRLWVATFGDVTRYVRERMSARVQDQEVGDGLTVSVTHPLDPRWYGLPLTLKTFILSDWTSMRVRQGEREQQVKVQEEGGRKYILYRVTPNAGSVTISAM